MYPQRVSAVLIKVSQEAWAVLFHPLIQVNLEIPSPLLKHNENKRTLRKLTKTKAEITYILTHSGFSFLATLSMHSLTDWFVY